MVVSTGHLLNGVAIKTNISTDQKRLVRIGDTLTRDRVRKFLKARHFKFRLLGRYTEELVFLRRLLALLFSGNDPVYSKLTELVGSH
jgi:hypothetical protein